MQPQGWDEGVEQNCVLPQVSLVDPLIVDEREESSSDHLKTGNQSWNYGKHSITGQNQSSEVLNLNIVKKDFSTLDKTFETVLSNVVILTVSIDISGGKDPF